MIERWETFGDSQVELGASKEKQREAGTSRAGKGSGRKSLLMRLHYRASEIPTKLFNFCFVGTKELLRFLEEES